MSLSDRSTGLMEAPNGETGKNRTRFTGHDCYSQGLSFAARLPLVPLFERWDCRHTTTLTA